MCLEQRRGHRQRVIQISQRRGRVLRPRVQHRLRRGGNSFFYQPKRFSSPATICLAFSSRPPCVGTCPERSAYCRYSEPTPFPNEFRFREQNVIGNRRPACHG
jgi:hypothetical protein